METTQDPRECKHYDDGLCDCFPIKRFGTIIKNGYRSTIRGKSCQLLREKGLCPDFTPKTDKK